MEVRLLRHVYWSILIVVLLASVAPSAAGANPAHPSLHRVSLTQADDELDAAADAVREFSELEGARDFDALYGRLHPDARAIVPRSAVVGWYEAFLADRLAGAATITEVRA